MVGQYEIDMHVVILIFARSNTIIILVKGVEQIAGIYDNFIMKGKGKRRRW